MTDQLEKPEKEVKDTRSQKEILLSIEELLVRIYTALPINIRENVMYVTQCDLR